MAGPPLPPPADWEIPPEAFGSQRLYRVTFSGADGQGSLRLTLRLEAPQRYQVQAADPLGRAVWQLAVFDGKGLWLDHRRRVFCRFEDRFDLPFLRLGPLPLPALPALLLGRLPAAPAAASTSDAAEIQLGERGDGGREESYRDGAGRLWTARLKSGRLESWNLEDGGVAALSWVRSGGGWMILSDRRKALQIRWKETLREALRNLPPPSAPPDYGEQPCAAGSSPPPAGSRG
jgi:hypothetical protein